MTLLAVLQLPKDLKVSWALSVELCESRYCQTVDKLSKFYASHGITMMQQNGVEVDTKHNVKHSDFFR